MDDKQSRAKERQALHHEPVPGYRTVFYVVISAACLYLAVIFFFWK